MNKLNNQQESCWFTILSKENPRELWSSELEIIFILRGSGQVCYNNMKSAHTVVESDIFVVNSFEMCNLELESNAVALSFSVSLEYLSQMSPEILKYQVHCHSYLHAKNRQTPFDALRKDLAKTFEEQYKNVNQDAPYLRSKVSEILNDLSKYFLDKHKMVDNKGSFESLKKAVNYIQVHYRENITLDHLAKQTYLSKTYISRSFTKHFEMSFTDYITLLRLSYATRLMQSNETLTEIAFESGFPNVNAMIIAFKRHRGITPGEYRRRLEQNQTKTHFIKQSSLEEANETFSSLMKYVSKTTQSEVPIEKITEIVINMNGRKQRILSHWNRLLNGGYARSVLDRTIQQEIRFIQEKVGFEYIRIKGVLDDDMCLLRMDMHGNPIVNYAYVDEVIDFILSVNAKPMIELSFMPQLLARDDTIRSMRMGYLSAPKDNAQWHSLIKSLISHLMEKYDDSQVRTWMFSPWLSPDFIDFGLCSPLEYEEIYYASYSAIKAVNPNYLIVGPGSTDQKRYLKKFIQMCKRKNCLPDVFSFHSFATINEQVEEGLSLIGNNESFPMAVSADENLIKSVVSEINQILCEENLQHIPLILEEWSNNIWQRDLCNDTCYKSAYLFKNILENNQSLSAMGYFSINDRIDEVPPANVTFHGGFGLFTQNDIPKAACTAFELLGQMGTKLLQNGEGYFITQKDNEIQIFLYNYCHYDLLYRYRHVVNMDKKNRDHVFVPKEAQAFYIQFENMEAGAYDVRHYGITQEGGSSYDAWVKMGAPEPIDAYERQLLIDASHPLYYRNRVTVSQKEQVLNIKASLKPLEVALIKITIPTH